MTTVTVAACGKCTSTEMRVFTEDATVVIRCAACKTPWCQLPEWVVVAGHGGDPEDVRAAMERPGRTP